MRARAGKRAKGRYELLFRGRDAEDVINDGERRRERDREGGREREKEKKRGKKSETVVMAKRRGWKTGDSGREWTARAISGGD